MKKPHKSSLLKKEQLQKALKKRDAALLKLKEKMKIEEALEQVRTSSLAMQTTNELQNVVNIVFEELSKLNIGLDSANINVWKTGSRDVEVWAASLRHSNTQCFHVPYFDHPIINDIWKASESGQESLVKTYTKKDKDTYVNYFFEHTDLKNLPNERKRFMLDGKGYSLLYTYAKNVSVSIYNYNGKPFPDSVRKVLIKFARVFEQAYVRFLDLQKAEAQAREAQIQLSLERVRARAMAMHQSDELSDVLSVLFEQFDVLGISPMYTFLSLIDLEKNSFTYRQTGRGGKRVIAQQVIDLDAMDVWKQVVDKWKSARYDVVETMFFPKESVKEVFKVYAGIYSALPEGAKVYPEDFPNGIYATVGASQFGHLGYDHFRESTEEEKSILLRFNTEFVRLYQRFLDLQKAEAQARESQIQLALERVRARTMAMHDSSELAEAATLLFDQLKQLGAELWTCGFAICDKHKDVVEKWMTTPSGQIIDHPLFFPISHPEEQGMYEAWKNGVELTTTISDEEELRKSNENLITLPFMKDFLEDFMKSGFSYPKWVQGCVVSYKHGYLLIVTIRPFEETQIFIRFAKVFEQTYTRFLDLQKAEAQAREAQIEAALERIRSRSMAMHKSEELLEVITVVSQQLQHLKFKFNTVSFAINNQYHDYKFWFAVIGNPSPIHIQVPYLSNPMFDRVKEVLANGTGFYADILTPEESRQWHEHVFAHADLPFMSEETKAYILSSGYARSVAIMPSIMLIVSNYAGKPYADDDNDIIRRFAAVFEQSYTRFLDLQKAEAQAREAKIEAALERVRARAMSMQKSDELAEAAQLLYNEFGKLGINTFTCGYMFINETKNTQTAWVVLPDGTLLPDFIVFPLTGDHILDNRYNSWKQKEDIHIADIQGEVNKEHHRFLSNHVPASVVEDIFSRIPERIIFYSANFSEGYLLILATELFSPIDKQTIIRFTKVFEMTYTRFQDLKQAEAQAREAKIETALERVRSNTMAMHHSEELKEVISVTFDQLKSLNIIIDSCIITLFIEGSDDLNNWVASAEQKYPQNVRIPYFKHPLFDKIKEAKNNPGSYFTLKLSKQENQSFYTHILENSDFGKIINEDRRKLVMNAESNIMSFANFKYIGLRVGNFRNHTYTPDENNTILRFANVFEQTYTRFLDLQKAEAQAREAQIEAGLERVRSSAMAMRTSEELNTLIGKVFTECTKLDIQLDRGIITIFDPETLDYRAWMANPEAPNLPRNYLIRHNLHRPYQAQLKAWREQVNRWIYVLEGKEKEDWDKFLFHDTELALLPPEVKRGMMGFKKIFFNGSYNNFGSLILTTAEPMTDETFDILLRFAKVFDLTYTRFNDLRQAEAQAREARIEAGLERVRAITMAMHKSEQLAGAATVLFEQFFLLGKIPDRISIGIIKEEEQLIELWVTNQHGNQLSHGFNASIREPTTMAKMVAAWKEGKDSIVIDLTGKELQDWLRFVREEVHLEVDDSNFKGRRVHQGAFFSQGMLLFSTHEPVGDEVMQLLGRFARVFDQTYTRFLDLQKAEAQAREAKIETSLERVRGKAMAMHSSEDLAATIGIFYRELESFSITARRCGVGLLDKETRMAELSTMSTTEQGDSMEIVGQLKMKGHPVLEGVFDHWISQQEYHPVLRGNEIKEYYQLLRPQIALPEYPNDAVQYGYFFFFPEGGVYAWTERELIEDELKIYRRFTSVLSLTYKRHKDLKDAEARAQLAIRESSLNRVRAGIASMRTSEDLQRITPLVWHELIALGVPFFRCGVFILSEEEHTIHMYLSTPQGKPLAALHLGFDSSEINKRAVEHWRSQKVFTDHWNKEQFTAFTKSLIEQGQIQTATTFQGGDEPPESITLQFIPFAQGMLYVGSATPLSSPQIELVQALAEAFSVAYARYEDFTKLELAKHQIEKTLVDLKLTQAQLVQSEKMASLGELTAGIAHEIQNPLNFVNNFSELSTELLDEMINELTTDNKKGAISIADSVKQNLEKILHHGKRADGIVKGMLQHSRSSSGQKEPTNINGLADEYLRLAYHGLRAKDKSFNATLKTEFDESIGNINIIPQDIGRAILNLITNAFYAVAEKKQQAVDGQPAEASAKAGYEPTVSVRTKKTGEQVEVSVKDNGNGIPLKVLDKIFQPFFTTKPTGQGTGLGLSLSYDIIKAHGGEIKVHTKENEGTEFTIQLPTV